MEKKLSTTSYALLGLLAARPFSAYELAQLMKTSNLARLWPRAQSAIYDEPKKLVDLSLAQARRERISSDPDAKGRERTVYEITPKGRQALVDWLAKPGAPLATEFEAGLHIAYAEQGEKSDLVATLHALRDRGDPLTFSEGLRHMAEKPAFPERIHVSVLIVDLFARLERTMTEWLDWADEVIEDWDSCDTSPERRRWASDYLLDLADRAEALDATKHKPSR
jgi:DNA-binding PadR family transcriptional regulator